MDSLISKLTSQTNSFSNKIIAESPKMEKEKSLEESIDKSGITSVKDWWLQQVDCHSDDEY